MGLLVKRRIFFFFPAALALFVVTIVRGQKEVNQELLNAIKAEGKNLSDGTATLLRLYALLLFHRASSSQSRSTWWKIVTLVNDLAAEMSAISKGIHGFFRKLPPDGQGSQVVEAALSEAIERAHTRATSSNIGREAKVRLLKCCPPSMAFSGKGDESPSRRASKRHANCLIEIVSVGLRALHEGLRDGDFSSETVCQVHHAFSALTSLLGGDDHYSHASQGPVSASLPVFTFSSQSFGIRWSEYTLSEKCSLVAASVPWSACANVAWMCYKLLRERHLDRATAGSASVCWARSMAVGVFHNDIPLLFGSLFYPESAPWSNQEQSQVVKVGEYMSIHGI